MNSEHNPYEGAFEEAGFTGIRRVRPELSEQGRARYGSEYWEKLLRCPPACAAG